MAEKTAVYPGTFDPMTRGHFDLITRAAGLYDRLIVAVASTSAKTGALYDAAHRLAMIREDVEGAGLGNVTVEVLDTLLVDFCRRHGARVVIRGVRVYSDFEYEFQMTALNYQLDRELETLFIMSPPQHMYLSSSIVREIASMHGDVSPFVPPCVDEALKRRFGGEA